MRRHARGAWKRASRGAFAALALLGVFIAAPEASADVKTFDVVACQATSGRVNNAWMPLQTGSDSAAQTHSTCPPAPGLPPDTRAELLISSEWTDPRLPDYGEPYARWDFTAPAGTTIRSMVATQRCATDGAWEATLSASSGPVKGCVPSESGAPISLNANAGSTRLELMLSCNYPEPDECAYPAVPSYVSMSDVRVTVNDPQPPTVTVINGNLPAGWASNEALVVFDASDNVGIREARLLIDGVVRGSVAFECDHTLTVPCENQDDAGLTASLTGLAEGLHSWQLEVRDAAGNSTLTPARQFTLDRRAPDVYIDGILYERRSAPLVPDSYDITVDAVSADPTRADSGVVEVRVFVDGALVHVAGNDEPCAGAQCDVDTRYDLEAGSMTGTHSIDVRATDVGGNVRSVPWTVDFSAAPTPPPEVPFSLQASPFGSPTNAIAGCDFTRGADARLLIDERPRSLAHSRWSNARGFGQQTTERFTGGRYRVTRCTDAGELVISQLVGPVPVPGGVELLEIGRTVREGDGYGTSVPEYADPDDPAFQRAWRTGRREAVANVIAPAIK
jgi:hypothetical protein